MKLVVEDMEAATTLSQVFRVKERIVAQTFQYWMVFAGTASIPGTFTFTIKEGSSMFRESVHRWKQNIFCVECAKPILKESLECAQKALTMFPKSEDENSAYQLFLGNAKYFETVLNYCSQ